MGHDPRLCVVLQCYNERRHIHEWLNHVAAFADSIVVLDDGSNDGTAQVLESRAGTIRLLTRHPKCKRAWSEPTNRRILVAEAATLDAQWIFAIDADERLEMDGSAQIKAIVRSAEDAKKSVVSFRLRELWGSPSQYRRDGIWGEKRKASLFKYVAATHQFDDRQWHGEWYSLATREDDIMAVDVNIYHLAMITAANRRARCEKYKLLDPECAYQAIGYDYLVDESGIDLEDIPPTRMYFT
jgi:glycosyltransferase involved in cell wall biosynthesis